MPLRALVLLHATALCLAAAGPSDPARIRANASSLIERLGVQSRLPTDSATPEVQPESRPHRSLWGNDGFSVPGLPAVVDLLGWALIVGAAIALIAVLAIMFGEPLQSRLRPALAPPVPLTDLPRPPPDPSHLIGRADQLAAAGQYAEAMHCVLLAAITILGRGKPLSATDSLTSWELLRVAALAPPQLDALRDLFIRAERAWFGQRPAGPDDYRRVRGNFEVFAAAATESA